MIDNKENNINRDANLPYNKLCHDVEELKYNSASLTGGSFAKCMQDMNLMVLHR